MKEMTGGMLIAAHEARSACKGEPNIEARLTKAMRACRNHWMETDETSQFRAAVAAAILESPPEERDRIERSARQMNKLGAVLQALQAGVVVDMEAMLQDKTDEDLLPLRRLWDDASPENLTHRLNSPAQGAA